MSKFRRGFRSCVILAFMVSGSICQADSFSQKEAKLASGPGTLLFVAAGVALPLLHDGGDGKEQSLRTADAIFTSALLAEGLKHVVREKRPRSNERTSFPSGHATAAFAVATMESHYHPDQALWWYGGASVIAASRVQKHAHYTHDVLAGAALGYLTSHYEISRPHGLLLAPFIAGRSEERSAGLSLTMNF